MMDLFSLWLLGFGIKPESVLDDPKVAAAIESKDGKAVHEALLSVLWARGDSTAANEISTPEATLECMCFISGKPALFK